MKRLLLLPAAALAAACLSHNSIAAALLPEIVFKDTFDSAVPIDDINQDAALRQSGTLAPLTYATSGGGVQLGQDGFMGLAKLVPNSDFSPNMNFIGSGSFTIEFDADPGVDDDPSDGLSGDWSGIVFGASTQDVFMNASDGVGILFRNNGDIQTFTGTAAIGGGPGITGGLPRDHAFHVKINVETAAFDGSPATVTMFIDGQPAAIGLAGSTTLTKADGFKNNYITLEGIGAWTHVFDNLQISAIPAIAVTPGTVSINRATSVLSENVTVTIPSQVNATAPAQMKISSSNPQVAIPTGADGSGALTLNFAAGGPVSQTFTVTGVAPGATALKVEGPTDVKVSNNLSVFVISGVGVDELLFKDTFETSDTSFDINFEVNGARQTGTAKNTAYSEPEATAAGGVQDEQTVVNAPAYPGKLWIIDQGAGVSPRRNFNDGPEFYIEAEVNPGANVTDHSSDNWSAIVFGTRTPNSFVISADGFGILFRNNGAIEVWDAGNKVFSSATGVLPEPPFKVRIDSKAVNFAGAPATISLQVNGQAMPLTATSATYVKTAGFFGNYVTLEGTGGGLDHVFDDFTIGAKSCITFRDQMFETAPGQNVSTTVEIPAALTATTAAVVKVRSSNPAIANATGAVNGEITLNFAVGQNTAPLAIEVPGSGQVRFELSNALGICMGEPLVVNSRMAIVRNPSFEANYNTAGAHYSAITGWDVTGGTGVNESTGPFADNGTIPDQSRAAFLQGAASVSQTIAGLVPGKKYWLQYRYNARGCCGGTIDLSAQLDDVEIDHVTDIKAQGAAGYGFRSTIFTAANATAKLGFVTTANGDASAILDAVSITQRDDGNVVIDNPSFEASGDAALATGIIAPKQIEGWTVNGSVGVILGGAALADNGKIPDQDHVAFLQGAGASIKQTIKRMTAGSSYKLQWNYNAPTSGTPHLKVKIGDTVVWEQDVTAVGAAAAYRNASVDFVASGTSADVTFEQSAADQTALLDDIHLLGQAITLPCLGVTPSKSELSLGQSATISISVPPQLIAAGPATISLSSANKSVAKLEGANVDGLLSVTFDAGGETRKDITLTAVSLGRTTIDVIDSAGLCVDNGVAVSVVGSFVRNPSFESNLAGNFPGYGAIDSWAGGSGLNNLTGPFHDNGQLPDRKQVAFMQNSGSLSQTLANLVPGKNYWVQFRYNTRDCCGGTIGLSVQIDGTEILLVDSVTPVHSPNPYYVGQAEFTASNPSAVLAFVATASGDATLLLDAVNVVQRDTGGVVVVNPSFEAEGSVAFPGYIQPDNISGWTGTGNYGVNVSGVGPFADNGVNPDQDSVVFLQNAASLSQTLTGLSGGANYTATFAVNARSGNTPHLKVSFDNVSLLDEDVSPVGGVNAYTARQVTFTASGEQGTLKFEQTTAADNTLLLDNVIVRSGGVVEVRPKLTGITSVIGTMRLAWPVSATGFNLYSSATVNGTYTAVIDPVAVEGANNVVTVQTDGSAKFYQLRK
jgi:hypothetical protein